MVQKNRLKDGMVLGALLGLMATVPKISVVVTDFLNEVIPVSWYVFGDFSLAVFGIILGAIIGLIIDKT